MSEAVWTVLLMCAKDLGLQARVETETRTDDGRAEPCGGMAGGPTVQSTKVFLHDPAWQQVAACDYGDLGTDSFDSKIHENNAAVDGDCGDSDSEVSAPVLVQVPVLRMELMIRAVVRDDTLVLYASAVNVTPAAAAAAAASVVAAAVASGNTDTIHADSDPGAVLLLLTRGITSLSLPLHGPYDGGVVTHSTHTLLCAVPPTDVLSLVKNGLLLPALGRKDERDFPLTGLPCLLVPVLIFLEPCDICAVAKTCSQLRSAVESPHYGTIWPSLARDAAYSKNLMGRHHPAMLPRSNGSSFRSSSVCSSVPATAAGKAWVKMMYRRVLSARARARAKPRRSSGRGVLQAYPYPSWSRAHNAPVDLGVFAPLAAPSPQHAGHLFLPGALHPLPGASDHPSAEDLDLYV